MPEIVFFENLDAPEGLKKLDEYLVTRSYLDGYYPTQNDVGVFDQIDTAPEKETFVNVFRWYTHIAGFSAEQRKEFPGAFTFVKPEEKAEEKAEDEDEDFDLFEEDSDEDEEFEKRAAEAQERILAKKAASGKDQTARSLIVLDVKPWDDETDLDKMEESVRTIAMDGLRWGEDAKRIPLAFGIHCLRIGCVVDDLKVSAEDLQEKIEEFDDYVQSTDIFNFQVYTGK